MRRFLDSIQPKPVEVVSICESTGGADPVPSYDPVFAQGEKGFHYLILW
jgi:hypothetical protein